MPIPGGTIPGDGPAPVMPATAPLAIGAALVAQDTGGTGEVITAWTARPVLQAPATAGTLNQVAVWDGSGNLEARPVTIDGSTIGSASGTSLSVASGHDLSLLGASGRAVTIRTQSGNSGNFRCDSFNQWTMTADTATRIPLTIQGVASQSGKYLRAIDVNSVEKFSVGADGGAFFNGNVGIGVTPAARLHVSTGSSTFTPYTAANTVIEHSTSNYLQFLAGGANANAGLMFNDATGTATDGRLVYNTLNRQMQFWTANTQKVTIASSGILSTQWHDLDSANSPLSGSAIFKAKAGYHAVLVANNDVTKYAAVQTDGKFVTGGNVLLNSAAPTLYLGNDSDQYITGNATSNYMTFSTGNVERVRITSDGKVGIGMTPDVQFNVSSTARVGTATDHVEITSSRIKSISQFGDRFQIVPNANSVLGMPTGVDGGAIELGIGAGRSAITGGGMGNGYLGFYTGTDYTAAKMTIGVTGGLTLSPIWNASVLTFGGIHVNVRETASAADSRLLNLQINSVDKFVVSKTGAATLASTITATGAVINGHTVSAASAALDGQTTSRLQVGHIDIMGGRFRTSTIGQSYRLTATCSNVAGGSAGYLFGLDGVQFDSGLLYDRDTGNLMLVNGSNSNSATYTPRLTITTAGAATFSNKVIGPQFDVHSSVTLPTRTIANLSGTWDDSTDATRAGRAILYVHRAAGPLSAIEAYANSGGTGLLFNVGNSSACTFNYGANSAFNVGSGTHYLFNGYLNSSSGTTRLGINSAHSTSYNLLIGAHDASKPVVAIQGATSHTGDLLQLRNGAGTLVGNVTVAGAATFSSTITATGATFSGNIVAATATLSGLTVAPIGPTSDALTVTREIVLGSAGGVRVMNLHNGSTEMSAVKLCSSSPSAGFLLFATNNGSGLTERGRINPAGRWLIGTTTDDGTSRLQVSGAITATGLTVNGSILPDATATRDIGASANRFNYIYGTNASFSNTVGALSFAVAPDTGSITIGETRINRGTGGVLRVYSSVVAEEGLQLGISGTVIRSAGGDIGLSVLRSDLTTFANLRAGEGRFYAGYMNVGESSGTLDTRWARTGAGAFDLETYYAAGLAWQQGYRQAASAGGVMCAFFGGAPVLQPAALTAAIADVATSSDAAIVDNLRTRVNEIESRLTDLHLIAA